MQCKLRKLLSTHKSHVRETSLFTGAISNPVCNSQTSRFGARSKSGKVKPGRQRGATVAVGDDGGRVVVQRARTHTSKQTESRNAIVLAQAFRTVFPTLTISIRFVFYGRFLYTKHAVKSVTPNSLPPSILSLPLSSSLLPSPPSFISYLLGLLPSTPLSILLLSTPPPVSLDEFDSSN